jgi:hypothetical protein
MKTSSCGCSSRKKSQKSSDFASSSNSINFTRNSINSEADQFTTEMRRTRGTMTINRSSIGQSGRTKALSMKWLLQRKPNRRERKLLHSMPKVFRSPKLQMKTMSYSSNPKEKPRRRGNSTLLKDHRSRPKDSPGKAKNSRSNRAPERVGIPVLHLPSSSTGSSSSLNTSAPHRRAWNLTINDNAIDFCLIS